MRVHVLLFDGFDPLDVLGPVEVFTAGADPAGGGISVEQPFRHERRGTVWRPVGAPVAT